MGLRLLAPTGPWHISRGHRPRTPDRINGICSPQRGVGSRPSFTTGRLRSVTNQRIFQPYGILAGDDMILRRTT